MGKVQSNDLSYSYAREASPGVLPGTPDWRLIEPNDNPTWGNEIKTTPRNPISKNRQRRKGAVTDLDSGLEINCDLTMSSLRDFIESFAYARAVGPEAYQPTAVDASGYTVPALSATQAGHLLYGASAAKTLVHARGFVTTANNGVKVLTSAGVTSATTIPVTGLTAETVAADQLAEVAICGIRGAAGDIEMDANGDLISTVLDFTTLGLVVGQRIHVGGVDVTNQFFTAANNDFARVKAVAAHKITLEKRNATFVVDDGTDTGSGGTGVQIDLLFGQFIRNVAVDHADYRQITNQVELASPGLGSSNETMYEYSQGLYANEMTISIPLSGKAEVKFGFVGKYTTSPSTSRATGAANAKDPVATEAFGTASDIGRLRVQDVDESGLSTDFKSMTITLKNNTVAEKVLGVLGAKYVNAGNLEVDIDTELIFSNANVIDRIVNNKTVGLDAVLLNGDGGFCFDLPSSTIGSGKRNIKQNESVTLQTKFESFGDANLGCSFAVSLFPVLPVQQVA